MNFRASAPFALIAVIGLLVLPALGQHDAHGAVAASPPSQSATQTPADEHADHAMPEQNAAAPMPGQPDTARMESPATGEDVPVGHNPAPPQATLGAADAKFGASAMNAARSLLQTEHGGEFLWKVMFDHAEYRAGREAGYGWYAEAWFGGDLDRLVIKTEGEGTERDGLENAEWQALYSRAIGPYTDLQLGLRQDIAGYSATYVTFGVETLLPYWLKAEGALFVSTRGDTLARLEGTYDLLLTQNLVLQPNLELNFSMQDIPTALVGGGLSNLTAGLRLRYDISRQFSPYVGVNFERSFFGTADFHRAAGQDVEATTFVLGIRAFL